MRGVLVLLLLLPALSGCLQQELEGLQAEPAAHPLERSTFSWTPFFPKAGEPVTFHATVRSTALGDQLLGLKWDLDGTVTTTKNPVHTFTEPGFHPVAVTIQTRDGGRYLLNDTVEVLAGTGGPAPTPSMPTPPPTPTDGPVIVWTVDDDPTTVVFTYRFDEVPESIHWEFGDGEGSNEATPVHKYATGGDHEVILRILAASGIHEANATVTLEDPDVEPHVIVAVPDSGINPYHELYLRPERTAHPCTYIEDFPCDIPALNLTLDAPDWKTAFEADKERWESVRPGDWYWIPGTVFVAVHCDEVYDPAGGDICILDDSHMHGTGTTSSVLMENPDALIAFKEYDPDIATFERKGIPVDVYSVSWGASAPVVGLIGWTPALPLGLCPWDVPDDIVYVKSSGNEPGLTVLADCWSGHPDAISVGGAYAQDDSQEVLAYKDMDVVSYFCRPTANTRTLTGMRDSYCGTSFAAPTVAGALSKVILDLRRHTGYTGSVEGGVVDPILGVTVDDLRDAMEVTASYDPQAEYDNTCLYCPPANPVAPWLQWGWGFYDGTVAEKTTLHLLGQAQPDKSFEARTYLEAQYAVREELYG